MSLRAFHIIFITVVTLFCLAVAVWALYFNAENQDMVIKSIGWSCVCTAIIAPIYGVYFYRKALKQLN